VTIPETPSPDKSPDRITPSKAMEADQAIRQPSSGQNFQSYMQKGASPTSSATQGPNPMELSRSMTTQTGTPTVPSLLSQAQTAQDTLGTVHKQLQTPNLQLKRSQAHLLRNKLNDAKEYSRSASAKLGVETPPMKAPSESGAISRFLAQINDGQDQFTAIQNKLQEMSASGQQLSAGDMLILQSKMGLAQQEIEYSSTLLSRITSSITTIMSIQL
jgi:hypothetical protein